MDKITMLELRKNMKMHLTSGKSFWVTSNGLPIAEITPVELKVSKKVAPICQMGTLSNKLPCTNASNGKYAVKLRTPEDDKSWELYLCGDHVKVIEGQETMEIEKI